MKFINLKTLINLIIVSFIALIFKKLKWFFILLLGMLIAYLIVVFILWKGD
jgi:hypothetical protein